MTPKRVDFHSTALRECILKCYIWIIIRKLIRGFLIIYCVLFLKSESYNESHYSGTSIFTFSSLETAIKTIYDSKCNLNPLVIYEYYIDKKGQFSIHSIKENCYFIIKGLESILMSMYNMNEIKLNSFGKKKHKHWKKDQIMLM